MIAKEIIGLKLVPLYDTRIKKAAVNSPGKSVAFIPFANYGTYVNTKRTKV